MATRFYFPAGGVAEIDPGVANSGFAETSQRTTGKLCDVKTGSPFAMGSTISIYDTDHLDRQFVSNPITGDQTISGTVKGQIMVREFADNDDVDMVAIHIYVLSNDCSTLRGTLLGWGVYGPTSEFINNATCRNKKIAVGDTLTSVDALDGDRIVVEIGYTYSVYGTTPEAAAKWGDDGDDLPEDETQTTDGVGWIEFSANINHSGLPENESSTPDTELNVTHEDWSIVDGGTTKWEDVSDSNDATGIQSFAEEAIQTFYFPPMTDRNVSITSVYLTLRGQMTEAIEGLASGTVNAYWELRGNSAISPSGLGLDDVPTELPIILYHPETGLRTWDVNDLDATQFGVICTRLRYAESAAIWKITRTVNYTIVSTPGRRYVQSMDAVTRGPLAY
jgi:hypothetical protein